MTTRFFPRRGVNESLAEEVGDTASHRHEDECEREADNPASQRNSEGKIGETRDPEDDRDYEKLLPACLRGKRADNRKSDDGKDGVRNCYGQGAVNRIVSTDSGHADHEASREGEDPENHHVPRNRADGQSSLRLSGISRGGFAHCKW